MRTFATLWVVFETFSKSLPKVAARLPKGYQKDSQKRPNGSILGPEGNFLKVFGSYWFLLAPIGSYWLLLGSIGSYWLLMAPIGSYWLPLVPIGSYWLLLAPLGSSWLLFAPIGSYWLKFIRASRSFAKTGF